MALSRLQGVTVVVMQCISVRPTAQSSLALQCVNLPFSMRTSVIATFIHAPHACVQQLLSTHHQAELSPHAAHKPAEVAVCVELVDELRQRLQRRFAPAHLKGTAEGGKRGEMHNKYTIVEWGPWYCTDAPCRMHTHTHACTAHCRAMAEGLTS
jgi:hypothetical protein